MDKFKIGDKVNFVVEKSLLSGVITKFYKNTYNEEECSIKTEIKTFPHILLQRVSKINDEDDLIKKIADLEAKLAESEKEIKELKFQYKMANTTKENILRFFETQSNRIQEFENKLAEKDLAIEGLQEINKSLGQTCNNDAKEIERLREQLTEKDELLKQKIGNMKSTDFIKMCIKAGFMVEAKENDNQTAIDELEKVKEEILKERKILLFKFDTFNKGKDTALFYINEIINKQIKSLKGDK